MKVVLQLCVVALVMLVQLPREGDAVCCYGKGLAWKVQCKDCSKGTPFCANGKGCNIFGCNCMGGCREGPCPTHHNHHHHVKPAYEAPAGRDYESSYDTMPYGSDPVVPATSDYEVPATDPYGSDPVVPASSDYEVPATDPYGSDPEPVVPASSDDYTPAIDVASSSEFEMTSSSDSEDTAPIDCTHGCWGNGLITTGGDVVRAADENGDGHMDIEEAERFLVKRGLATSGYRAKRSLRAVDLDNDNFISAEEIELYED